MAKTTVQIWKSGKNTDIAKIIEREHQEGESESDTAARLIRAGSDLSLRRIEKKLNKVLARFQLDMQKQ